MQRVEPLRHADRARFRSSRYVNGQRKDRAGATFFRVTENDASTAVSNRLALPRAHHLLLVLLAAERTTKSRRPPRSATGHFGLPRLEVCQQARGLFPDPRIAFADARLEAGASTIVTSPREFGRWSAWSSAVLAHVLSQAAGPPCVTSPAVPLRSVVAGEGRGQSRAQRHRSVLLLQDLLQHRIARSRILLPVRHVDLL